MRVVQNENSALVGVERFLRTGTEIADLDHLLSIREVTDAGASIQAGYDYAPYGFVTKVTGSNPDFFGFTGILLHDASDMFLMKRRGYVTTLQIVTRSRIS